MTDDFAGVLEGLLPPADRPATDDRGVEGDEQVMSRPA
jgi:hypothetical protein